MALPYRPSVAPAQRRPAWPWALGLLVAAWALAGRAQPAPDAVTAPAVAVAMQTAAAALLAVTETAGRSRLAFAFDDTLRADWHYTPRSRAGLALKDMNPAQKSATRALLEAPLSQQGLVKVDAVMALEYVLRELEAGSALRVPENYAVAVYGQPVPGGTWGWRIEGHHLSLHFTVSGDGVVSTLPQFIGANPAVVARDVPGGPKAATRPLGAEEDAARALLASLSPAQRVQAVVSSRSYGDILSRNAANASPLDNGGLRAADMDGRQRSALMALVAQFAAVLKPQLAAERLQRARRGDAGEMRFAWAGSQQAGGRHYFRIQGERFLIEYDNSGGNHVHSVWRDFEGDWGRDVLADHYRRAGQQK